MHTRARALILWILGATALPLYSCAERTPTRQAGDREPMLATIGAEAITVDELSGQISGLSPSVRAQYATIEQKRQFLDQRIEFELLAQEAFARGYQHDPDIERATKQMAIRKLMKGVFEDRVDPAAITDEELRAYYREHEEGYQHPAQVRLSVIALSDRATAAAIVQKTRRAGNTAGDQFARLAIEHSLHTASAANGGDLGFFDAASSPLPGALTDLVFEMGTGQISEPVKVGEQFYVLRKTGARRAVSRSFDQVKEEIRSKLLAHRRAEVERAYVAELKQRTPVRVFDSNLPRVAVDGISTSMLMSPR